MEIDPSRLEYLSKLAQGAFGVVHLATYEGERVAVKTIRHASKANMERRWKWFLEERALLEKLDHPHIVRYIGCHVPKGAETWEDVLGSSSQPCLVFGMCEGGTLRRCIQSARDRNGCPGGPIFPIDDVYRSGAEIASALAYLHSEGYVHRDVKSENVLVTETGECKLCDFGLACREQDALPGRSGSHRWMAPEVCRAEPYGKPADIFSFGVLMTELLTGDTPHSYLMSHAAADLTGTGLRVDIPSFCPSELRELIQACFRESPFLRPDASYLAEALQNARVQTRERVRIRTRSI